MQAKVRIATRCRRLALLRWAAVLDILVAYRRKQVITACIICAILISWPDHGPTEAQLTCSLKLHLHSLTVIIWDLLIWTPGDPFHSRFIIYCGYEGIASNNAVDLCVRQYPGRVRILSGSTAFAEDTARGDTRGDFECEWTTILAETQVNLRGRNIVSPEQVQAQSDFSQVGM